MVRAGAGLVAGAVLALTPAAALMFRFNNPDALLVLLMTASAYCMQRAIERDRTRWLVFAGVLLGFGFLTKMAQAFLVLPAFGIAYLWAGPARFRRRVWQVVVLGLSVVAGAGWWVAIAQLWPASSRPYFGGSTNNNILELALGYNGLGRLDGTETGFDRVQREQRGRRWPVRRRRWRRVRGRDRDLPVVRVRVRRAGELADPGGADLARRAAVGVSAALAGACHRGGRGQFGLAGHPDAGVRRDLGRLAAGDGRGVQLYAGDHPPVLHGGPRAGDRRARGGRRHQPVAGAARDRGPGYRRRRGGGDRLVVVRAARQDAGLAAVAALARADRGAGRHGRAVRGAGAGQGPGCVGGAGGTRAGAGVADTGAGLAAAVVRAGGGARRAARLLSRHGEPHVHRGDTERRADGDGRVRRAWRGPGRLRRVPARRVRRVPRRGDDRRDRDGTGTARALAPGPAAALGPATVLGPAGSAGSAGSAAAPARDRPAPGPGPVRSLVAALGGSAAPGAGSAAGCPAVRR